MTIGYYRDGKKQAAEARLDAEPIYTFGLAVRDLDDSHAKEMGLRSDFQAVVITKVDDDSPAARSENHRLYPGDVVYRIDTRFGSFRIRNTQDFERVMQMRPDALKIVIGTRRGSYEFLLRR